MRMFQVRVYDLACVFHAPHDTGDPVVARSEFGTPSPATARCSSWSLPPVGLSSTGSAPWGRSSTVCPWRSARLVCGPGWSSDFEHERQ